MKIIRSLSRASRAITAKAKATAPTAVVLTKRAAKHVATEWERGSQPRAPRQASKKAEGSHWYDEK